MITRVDVLEAQQLIADGVRTFDVLPAETYREEHLPGATSLPLETFEPDQVESLERSEPVLVYCFDQHCDLSARGVGTARRARLRAVHDLIGGRAAWTALGLPTEGAVGDRRRISGYVVDAASVDDEATIADVQALGEQRFPVAVVNGDGVLVGAVAPTGRRRCRRRRRWPRRWSRRRARSAPSCASTRSSSSCARTDSITSSSPPSTVSSSGRVVTAELHV